MTKRHIIIWQTEVTPHILGLAQSLGDMGQRVTYVADEMQSQTRAAMGWGLSEPSDVEVILIENEAHIDALASTFQESAVHYVQGVYANGVMEQVRRVLKRKRLCWGAGMETIDERSWNWPLRRLVYRRRLQRGTSRPDFILAIGSKTKDWVVARGYPADKIFPSTYFIPSRDRTGETAEKTARSPFCIGFVGSLVPLKRVDLLIEALAGLPEQDFELVIVGDGPLREEIRTYLSDKLEDNHWRMTGTLPMAQVHSLMNSFDCLVLPSDHDGWGAVVTEALMAGVPAICSDACGSAEAVRASGVGGVFAKGDGAALRSLLKKQIDKGAPDGQERQNIANWAESLGAEAGADYLAKILACVYEGSERPAPPWRERKVDAG